MLALMSRHTVSKSRVHHLRLWDEQGRLWDRASVEVWPQEVAALRLTGAPIAVHGYGRSMRWCRGREADDLIRHAALHAVTPDTDGLTYRACIWTSDGDRLLTFETFC